MHWVGIFTEHPASVGETYFGHQRRAFRVARGLLTASVAAIIHALVPALLETWASDRVTEIHNEIQNSRLRETG